MENHEIPSMISYLQLIYMFKIYLFPSFLDL
jgi:hypothetical protein